ncbi:dynein heavy chain, putative [Bodo saltans]|uniref:Dynein heavy chain, putative n=1 Tax=Bodo saltans TaxID=75058 RepID=A0A0S4JG66_BODSA|nr:dynein heavy chain, putative [Bodo saltans]|eukprot:CUG87383.1 dynein heavy chain, putative [Bodo saltans]
MLRSHLRPGKHVPHPPPSDAPAATTSQAKPNPATPKPLKSSSLFVDASSESFEPKVQVPFADERGRIPRGVEVQRRRKNFEDQDLAELFAAAGLQLEELAKKSNQNLPLEIFDDSGEESRNADEWMAIARRATTDAGKFLPAEAIRGVVVNGVEEFRMEPCRVVGWSQETNHLSILWGPKVAPDDKIESIPRIYVHLLADNPIDFVKRLVKAQRQRVTAVSWIKYRLCCDAMPIEGLEGLEKPVMERIRQLGTAIPQLSPEQFPEVGQRTERLMEELNLEWRRTHNRILLQHQMKGDEGLQRLVQSTTNLTLSQVTKGVEEGGATGGRAIVKLPVEGFNFAEKEKLFTFSTYYTQPEVVAALTGVRNECMKILEGSLFALPRTRQMTLAAFRQQQEDKMNHQMAYLKGQWMQDVCKVIKEAFHEVGKGWLNVNEKSQEIYDVSKLKKFFTTVKYMMEDTIFELVYRSLDEFTKFFEEVCAFTVEISDMTSVKNMWPGSEADDAIEKQPLFTLDLVERDGGFSYSTSPEEFEEIIINLFDAAIKCTEAIPQVEKYVMSQYFWKRDGDGPFLETVRKEEERVCLLRDRVRDTVRASLEPLHEYVKMYDELLDLVRLNRTEYIRQYSEEEHSTEEMKEEIRKHLKSKKSVAQRIPTYITVGNFVLDCQSFCYTMANKNQDLAKLVMDLICKIAKVKTTHIREEFTKIVKVFDKAPGTPEKLYDIKNFIVSLPEKVVELVTEIDDMRQYYTILEGFQYGLTDEDFKHKWEAIGWQRQLDLRIDQVNKELEKTEEELHARMVKDQEDFGKRVDALQRVVATFSKYTDATQADKVAAEVKMHNIEIKKCIEEARAINNDQRLFGDDLTDYRNVFDLEKEFKPFSDLWLTTFTWQDSYRKWYTDPFDSLDPDELESVVNNAAKTMTQLAKVFKDKGAMLKIVEEMKGAVDKFKPLVPVVMSLRHPGMKERHWQGLSSKLGFPIALGENLNTMTDCEPLIEYKDTIVTHCEVAAKEFQIEKSLREMRSKWESKQFIIEAYKETKTYILKDATDIIELMDEHLNVTQQLQFSHFKAYFATQIDEWEQSLNLVSEILEQWLECQRSWRYLEPIFNSEDIAMQLPKLSKIFDKVDKTWRKILGGAHQNPNVIAFCTGSNSKILDQFKDCNRNLEEVQKGLNDYLADKRQSFPRFYFLSDEELLEILSQSKDPRRIDDHLRKLFEFIDHMHWATDSTTMLGFYSVEGEYIPHTKPLTPEGNVESWLKEVELMMKSSVNNQVKLATEDYPKTARTKWVLKWAAQAVIAVSQVYWTSDCEAELSTKGHVNDFAEKNFTQLMDLVDVVQSPLKPIERINMGALITIEVHAKDTIDNMKRDKVSNANQFDWIKQLRFYFEADQLCHIRQVDAHFIYGGEYLGNTGRLVVTPLTDRIYLTLTGALALCLGGAPAGPAGTGKTETTKDLAKALAKQCVVFNCQEGMTYLSMAKFFKGLAWSGAWACFDEFNRIDVEVLSVVAQQVVDLQQACITKQYRIIFEESDLVVDPTYAIFITMNPGYAGRTELPDNLKVLFRPVACMVPDYALIGEIRLFSYGYKKARGLAQKMVMTFKLSSEQLSSQDHYDFGMRAVNTVISAAGLNKRENPTGDEDLLLLRALRDSNVPKFLRDDITLFEGIISDLFPGTELPSTNYGAVLPALKKAALEFKLQPVDAFIDKCLQLYDITTLRHGLMLVGPTGSGKTNAYKSLQSALTTCAVRQHKGEDMGSRTFMKVYTHICNPKSVTMDQLYGAYDENGEWKDGVLCILFRRAAKYGDEGNLQGKHWVMFDGPVDALWIESMNTVLDENKKLCLVSGEIIQMNRDMTMMFEVEDLAVASPATVSRCGMIYMEPESCAPTKARLQSWKESMPNYVSSIQNQIVTLAETYLDPMISFVRRNVKEYVSSVDNNLVHSFFNMFNGYIAAIQPPPLPGGANPMTTERLEQLTNAAAPLFFMSMIWSVGATCDEDGRELFSNELRQMLRQNDHTQHIPEGETVYDWCYRFLPLPTDEDPENGWIPWSESQAPFSMKTRMKYADVTVPTVDTIRQNYVLKHLLLRNCNVATVGPTGTGKSVAVNEMIMTGLPEKFQGLAFTFSAQTKSMTLQNSLMSKFDKRRSYVYGAPAGKQFLVFIDDTNLPQKEKYGAQPPLELLRQFLGHGGFYTLNGGIKWNSIIDVSLVLAMGPPGGGRNTISNRFMRYFNFISFPEMSDHSKRTILKSLLGWGFQLNKTDAALTECIAPLIEGTLSIFKKCLKSFLPTPAHVHYSFNMRDITRVFATIYECDVKDLGDKDNLVRMWMHENTCVFGDRLIDEHDRETFRNFLHEELVEKLGYEQGYDSLIPRTARLMFGDYMSNADRRPYKQISDMNELTVKINDYLNAYNEENQPQMGLVMFSDAIEHVSRIARVLRMPNGHCLLLGIGGSGRKSLTRLACFLSNGMELFTIEMTKNFGMKEWREGLAKLLIGCGKDDKKVTFLFTDTQIIKPAFLEDVAGLLTSGDVPNLFEDKDIDIINDKFKGICMSENLPTSKISMYSRFIKEVRSNLHLCLAFSPIGETFRTRMRMFPALINNCTIDWFAEWPKEALLSVAKAQIESSGTEFSSPELLETIAATFSTLHLSAASMIERFFAETKRRSYVTPTSYLSLLGTFMILLDKKRKFVFSQRGRLENGLDKLRDTEERVAELEEMLKAKQPVLVQKKIEIKEMMEKIAIDKKEAAEKEAVARSEEANATAKADECSRIRKTASDRLAEAEPALAEAIKVLSKIKAAEIGELNKYANPPKGVQYVMEAVAILLTFGNCPKEYFSGPPGGKKLPDWWLCAKSYMKNANQLLELLVNPPSKGGFDREAMDVPLMEKMKAYIDNEEFQPDKVRTVSAPCAGMCAWVRAMYTWFFVNREVQPLRDQLSGAEAELKVVTEALTETRAKLKIVADAVAALEAQFEEATATQKALEEEVEKTSQKLGRAARLIDGLGGEKSRWIELVAFYNEAEGFIVGDVLIAAGSVAYFGPLTNVYRKELLKDWHGVLQDLHVTTSEHYDLMTTTGNPVEIQHWQLCGLPTDALSTENAIIMTNAQSWPLLIDPQGQANTWIRNLHKDDNLQVCKASEEKFMKVIEGAIRLGFPCLLENVGESLEPALEPVLLRQTFLIGSAPHIRLGDSAIPYDANFKLYITTKLPNPRYTPETIVTVALLNFFITPGGLEDQLLGKTVEKERKDLEIQKQLLIKNNAEKSRELKTLQDDILRMLQEAEGDILEQEVLINTLEMSKKKSIEINEDIAKAKATEVIIDETRNKYRPHAFRGSLLFFCVSALSSVDPMYQFSLQWFMNLFLNGIDKADRFEDDVDARLESLKDFFTYSFYSNVCRSLFERHKLMFSFFLCNSIIGEEGLLDAMEYRFLLTGPTGSGGSAPNPAPDWLTDNSWNEIQFAAKTLPNFAGFEVHIKDNIEHYKSLFDDISAHSYPLAEEWQKKATPLQRLIITRCLRMDKVTHGIQDYVKHFIGERYIIVPQFNLMDAYKDSDCTTPLIFIISPGSDPMNDLLKFAEQMRMSKKLDKVSLGQGQGRKAEELMHNGKEKGQWVLLQNCHLATSWMPTLEVLVENFNPDSMKKEFRLWLTSMPSATFPVSVLQISVKMTNEPPKGLRANLTRSFFGFKEDDLNHATKAVDFKKMLFAQCLFHGVLQERRKFGSLGFNIPYEFNDSDRSVCLLQLRKFLEMYDNIPYDVLTFLTGEINYGGRVTDDWDRRCMMTMIKDFISPNVLEPEYHFSPSGTYRTIDPGNRLYYLDHLNSWPINPAPEVFGLHDNADITSARNETATILAIVLDLQSQGGIGGGAVSRDTILMRTALEIQSKVPPPFDIYEFQKKYPTRYDESMNTVLVQEAVRYNKLLKFMSVSVKEFIRAIKGEVGMSGDLEAMGAVLFTNGVPATWASLAYPSLMPLSSWVEDLVRRVAFIKAWYDEGVPKAFWIGGFFFPQAFLTGTLQNYARRVQQAIDTIKFGFSVMDKKHTEVETKPEAGAIIYGLFMEGARWDPETKSIAESRPKELFVDIPPLFLEPIVNKPESENVFRCPVYKTLTRAGTLSTTGHSTNFVLPIELPTNVNADHWIKRGVACFVSLNF